MYAFLSNLAITISAGRINYLQAITSVIFGLKLFKCITIYHS